MFTEIKQFRSAVEIDRAIDKLNRCQSLLQELWDDNAAYDDPRTIALQERIRMTVLEIFGPNSPEYGKHRYHRIGFGPERIGMTRQDNQARFRNGFPHTGMVLKEFINRLDENKSDCARDSGTHVRATFEGLDLHPRIAGVCADLYRDRHYRQAVLDASIALNHYVKEKSRQHTLDGSGLMTTVFSANKPILAFNEMKDATDRDEQEGLMHLFVGAILALRNPRAHALFDDSPELALDYIAFLSMLAKRLDTAKRA